MTLRIAAKPVGGNPTKATPQKYGVSRIRKESREEVEEDSIGRHRGKPLYYRTTTPIIESLLLHNGHRHLHTFFWIIPLVAWQIDDLVSHTNSLFHLAKYRIFAIQEP